MAAYLVVALSFTSRNAATQPCAGLHIVVRDSAAHPFVTADELARELGTLPSRLTTMRLADIDIDSIESVFERIDKIEDVRVQTLTDGRILVDVDPMEPVARVFPASGHSFYINRAYGCNLTLAADRCDTLVGAYPNGAAYCCCGFDFDVDDTLVAHFEDKIADIKGERLGQRAAYGHVARRRKISFDFDGDDGGTMLDCRDFAGFVNSND